MSEVDFDAPNAETAPPDETDAGPGMMIEMWDAVTEGTFDNLRIDTFFVILFISMLIFFLCFILPWAINKLDNMTKFELTPEMQQELKDLIAKKARGEYDSKSPVMNRLMEHQEKRDAHVQKMQTIQAKISAKRAKEATVETKEHKLGSNVVELRQRKSASKATAELPE